MEGLAHLVAESLVRHGFEPAFDHRRLQWSSWFRCQDGFSLVLAPCKPGLFALAEEVIAPGELAVGEGKRMLALFQISEAEDLGMALGRLFLSGSPERERFASGRCFARYVVIEDPTQRQLALTALQRWMTSSAEAVTGVPQSISGDTHVPDETHVAPDAPVRGVERSSASSTSAPGSQDSRYVSGLDTGSVSRPDTGSVSGQDNELVSRPDTRSVSRPDTELVSGQDNESVSRPDTGSVSGHDFSRAATAAISTAALAAAADALPYSESSNRQDQIGPPSPIPSGF